MKTIVKQKADELRKEGRVDVIKLANSLGVKVFPIENPVGLISSENAYIKKENGNYTIYVNPTHSKQRQRFSVAHEIAHLALHKDIINERGQMDRDEQGGEEECQADQFAAELLMPEDDIKEKVNDHKIDRKLVISLADRYNVSFTAMIVRLRSLDFRVPYITIYG